jgi:hypothetical protein
MKLRPLVFGLALAACAPESIAQAQRVPPPPPLPDQPAAVAPAPANAPATVPLDAGPAGALTRSGSGAEARAAEPPPTRWQADLDRLDADLRLRLLTAKDPRTDWLAGEVDTTDIESQVRHFTAARTAAPDDRLYLSTLGVACLQPTRPSLAQCDAVDRLADWARRDTDNGVPSILLAGRARQRGEADLAATFVEQAAIAPRFDDYWSQGAQRWWDYLRTLDVGIDPAAKAKAAWNYAASRELGWAAPLRALCADSVQRVDRMRSACAALGQAMMMRGATYALRRAGARVAELNAADAGARAAAQSRNARIVEMTARCTQAQPDFTTALESAQAPVRASAVEQFGAWALAQAREGEVGACEKLLARK